MKAALIAIALIASATAQADTYVNGYTRSNGTYVAPHMRSDSNSVRYDNYSSQGNTNPYTGQQGYQRNEYSNPPAYNLPSPSPYGSSNRGYGYDSEN